MIDKYKSLLSMLNAGEGDDSDEVEKYIRNALVDFCCECERPAIWCMGEHTSMLMIDYIFELKKVKYIIDKNANSKGNLGFLLISPDEIADAGIDGIIISSFKYREEVKEIIESSIGVKYLDIYDELDSRGTYLKQAYYELNHPYFRYPRIIRLQKEYHDEKCEKKIEVLRNIVKEYVLIKDFSSAGYYADALYNLSLNVDDCYICEAIKDIYECELDALGQIGQDSVLMLCVDGLRRCDLLDGKMPNLRKWLNDNTCFYTNAYSSSTSTYESLIPAYSGNNDLRTRYYESNLIEPNKCSFDVMANKQKRGIYFYTDGMHYINDSDIKLKSRMQTLTEKFWDLAVDGAGKHNALFYLHALYESHFSYVSPYTTDEIVADGTSIMFDFLESKGGRLRTDYTIQQKDALRYIDDKIVPFLEQLKCRMVFFADHGNIVLEKDDLKSLHPSMWSYDDLLFEIPLAIKAPEIPISTNNDIISLMEINDIICALLEKKSFVQNIKSHVKGQRSHLYNPDFEFLYKENGQERELLAFEEFFFQDGYRIVVYSDGIVYGFYKNEERQLIPEPEEHFMEIKDEITVSDRWVKQ